MNNSTYQSESVKDLARVFKVLSEPNRLRIVLSMGLECAPVSAIIAKTGLSQTNVSFHLRVLREAGLVKGERNGPFIFYCLYDTELLDILASMTKWREHILELQNDNEQLTTPARVPGEAVTNS
jgi:ArsR family transcriptional regulator